MANKSAGIIIFPEDIARIKRCVKPEYQFAVIYALSQYATDGVLPTVDELGEGGMVAFEFIFDKVRDALESYEKGRQQRQEAIRKRWEKPEQETIRNDTTVYDRIRPNKTESKTETETETEIINRNVKVEEERNVSSQSAASTPDENVIAFDGSDLAEDIRRNNVADDMIADFNLPCDRVTRSALLEDLEKHGEARMREVLTTACQSNSREKVTVNFWRAIIAGKGRDSPKNSGAGYGQILTQREYTPQQFGAMEVDIDAMDAHGRLPGELGYGT